MVVSDYYCHDKSKSSKEIQRGVATSNRIAYKECLILDNLHAEVIQLGSPSLECVERSFPKITRVGLVTVTITNEINGVDPV